MSISVSIMAHPKRAAFIPYIFSRLGQEAPVAWDTKNDRWDTGRRAWELHDPAATHHLVLQDDVILSNNLLQTLPRLVDAAPNRPISLFARNKAKWNPLINLCEKNKQVRWLVMPRLNWGPAILLPVPDINPMLKWIDKNCYMPNYDVRIALFYLIQNQPIWYTMPSLVDHRVDVPSLVWNNSQKTQSIRYAKYFIGEDKSGATMIWKGMMIKDPVPLSEYLAETQAINKEYRKAQTGGGK